MADIKPCNILLIDGFSLLYRAYYGYPPNLTTPSGTPINAVYGFVTLMLNAIKEFNPTYFGICLDRKEPTYRHTMFPAYKAHRSAPDDEFLVQLPEFKKVLAPFNVPLIELPGYESDDLLGVLSKRFSKEGLVTYIMSGDLDLLQLVDDHIVLATNKKGVSNYVLYNQAAIFDRYTLTPAQIIDFKALKGDASDNIPGVKGVGEKTALKLLSEFGDLDGIYAHLDYISSKSVVQKLKDDKDMAYLSKQLVTLQTECTLDVTLEQLTWAPNWEQVVNVFKTYEFQRLLTKIQPYTADLDVDIVPKEGVASTVTLPVFSETYVDIIQNEQSLERLLPLLKKGFAFDLETTSLVPQDAQIVAIGITASAGISFVLDCRVSQQPLGLFDSPLELHPLVTMLSPLLEDPTVPKIVQNAKYEMEVLACYGVSVKGIAFDTMIAAYCLDSRQTIGLKDLSERYLTHEMVSFESMMGEHNHILDVPFHELAAYVADDSNVTFQLYQLFDAQLTGDLRDLFFNIEVPLVSVLSAMELNGVVCDRQHLAKLSKEYTGILTELEQQVHTIAGHPFNLNSPKQLAEVLFDELKFPVVKKTKTSRSTDAYVLEVLAKDYDIAAFLLKYRTFQKLVSTYVNKLPELVHPITQKIHTSLNQTITATGRLSSNNPNLQNIPVRSVEGNNIRRAFLSRFKDGRIVSMDYSQIELRVLAHLSQDSAMMAMFKQGQDIHTATASKLFNVEYNSVTKPQREQAKTVNFGITYGQSAFALANQLSISRTEAKALIDAYYTQFSSIKQFMDKVVNNVARDGFVTTMMGRVRYIDDIDSSNKGVQQAAERMAINTCVQGSAADIIKKAMCDVLPVIQQLQSCMVLQVHDELVFDVHPTELDIVINKIKPIMESCMVLDVPLLVDVESGVNWGDLS
jgi:DNA polymerase I